jgi:DNA-binding transcriptional LysR family regulator
MKVAELENVSRAAEHLNVTQPSLSKIIGMLESELGVCLFDRIGKRIHLNEQGKIFLKRVSNSLKELEDGKNQIKKLSDTPIGIVKIGAFSATSLLSNCIAGYVIQNPHVHFDISTTIYSKSDFSEYDLVFYNYEGILNIDLESIPILTENFVIIMNKNHPLANREYLDLIELKNEKFVFYPLKDKGPDITYRLCLNAGFVPIAAYVTDNTSIKPELVASGAAVGLIPEIVIKDYHRTFPNMVFIKMRKPEFKRTVYLGWKSDNYMTIAAKSFKKYAIAYFKNYEKFI